MESAFVIVVVAVAVVGVIGAVLSLLSSRRTWDAIGRDRLLMDSEMRDAHGSGPAARAAPAAPASDGAERDAEIRQMLEARNARRRRRGEAPLDVEAELRRLTAPPPVTSSAGTGSAGTSAAGLSPGAGVSAAAGPDAELRAEIRDLVIARNHRRARRGEPPLDVEAEIERQIDRLSG